MTGGDGAILTVSPETLYRALGDRIVDGNETIGNNAADWNRVDPSLPPGRIALNLPAGIDEARILGAVRLGCRRAGGTAGACDRVGLRRDRILRQGGYFEDGASAAAAAAPRARGMQPIADPVEESVSLRTVMQPVADPVGENASSRGVMQPIRSPAVAPQPAPVPETVSVQPPPPPPAPEPAPMPAPVIETAILPAPVPRAPVPMAKPPVAAMASGNATASPPRTAAMAAGPGRVYASRLFVGREDFPPDAFAAYGIVAFSTLATSEDRDVYMAICEAFFSALINSEDIAAEASEQMVTVWPIDDRGRPDLTPSLNTTRAQEGSCENAVEYYDVQVARGAIGDAMQAGIPLSGRGPFLLAWAPAGMKGRPDAVVLAADLGDVKTVSDAKDVLRIWREDIEQDPELWQGGFSVEKIRVKLRLIVDRYGEGLLRFLGG